MSFVRRSILVAVLAIVATNAIATCSASELLISDRASSQILAFDGATGAYKRVVVAQDPTNLFSPAAMTIGFSGERNPKRCRCWASKSATIRSGSDSTTGSAVSVPS